jgi:hypothetical protein
VATSASRRHPSPTARTLLRQTTQLSNRHSARTVALVAAAGDVGIGIRVTLPYPAPWVWVAILVVILVIVLGGLRISQRLSLCAAAVGPIAGYWPTNAGYERR